jgi:hypothetical protein
MVLHLEAGSRAGSSLAGEAFMTWGSWVLLGISAVIILGIGLRQWIIMELNSEKWDPDLDD